MTCKYTALIMQAVRQPHLNFLCKHVQRMYMLYCTYENYSGSKAMSSRRFLERTVFITMSTHVSLEEKN